MKSDYEPGRRSFLLLSDVPSSYVGADNYLVKVSGSTLVFTSSADFVTTTTNTFVSLTDTPAAYTSYNNFIVSVNASANALSFFTSSANMVVIDGSRTMSKITATGVGSFGSVSTAGAVGCASVTATGDVTAASLITMKQISTSATYTGEGTMLGVFCGGGARSIGIVSSKSSALSAIATAMYADVNSAAINDGYIITQFGWINNSDTLTRTFTIKPKAVNFNAGWAVAAAPSGTVGDLAYCTNGNAGAKCLAFFDGTNWLRIALGAAISAT